jgi:hypothetical protein
MNTLFHQKFGLFNKSNWYNIHQRSYGQILLSVSFNPNKKAEEYASFLGVTKSKVYKVVELYNKEGAGFTENLKWGGRRSSNSHMSFEDEEKMMDDLKIKFLKICIKLVSLLLMRLKTFLKNKL